MTRSESGPVHPSSKKSLISVGRYQMLRVLGKGNFARVEEAVHTLLNVKVAVKVIDTGAIREDYVFKNLTREARLLSKLRHPNIVRLYETIQCGSVYCLVIELATGGDLSTHIKNQPLCRLDEKTAKGYARQLVSAMEHMHSRGIVHRDLKMENIMLQDPWKERIKIVDFGLSNMYTGDSLLKTHCGSPEYAAPELFVVGKKYGPEVDLWSLGVVFYAMATGRLPFQCPRDGQTSSEEHRRKLLTQINRGLTTAQKKTIASMSGEYRNLVNRLLMPAAHKRITIQELCFHPWIANRLKNVALKASQADLIALEHNTIVDEIAGATNMDRTFIERDILQSKYGELGGMYNIKAHVMRQAGSFHAFKARSWITASQPGRYTQNNHITENSRSTGFHVNTESSRAPPRRSMVFQRSPSSKLAASSNGGSRGGGTWTPKNARITSSATCPAHRNQSATSPGVHGSVTHHVRWESSAERTQNRVIPRTINKSVAGFAERPVTRQATQPMSRIVPPREVRTTPNVHPVYLRPEISLYHDPVEHCTNQKLKNLEKRDRSCLREQTCHASSRSSDQCQPAAVEAEYDARNDRPSPPTIQTLCKDIRSNQPGAMGQGDRVTERCFYRSPAVKTDVRTTRVALITGTRGTSERNIRHLRPLTACTESHNPLLRAPEPKHGVIRTSNKCEEACSIRQIGTAVRSAISAHERRRTERVSTPSKGAAAPSRRSLGISNSGTPISDRLWERLRNVRAEIQRGEAAQRETATFHCHFKEN